MSGKTQFCPTFEDIENSKIKELAKRLKGTSHKETLTNILEWQEKNIKFWWERAYLGPLLFLIIAFGIFVIPLFLLLINFLFELVKLDLKIFNYAKCVMVSSILLIMSPFIYLFLRYRPLTRNETKFEKIKKLTNFIINTFSENLLFSKILKYKLCVCKDYAKLTGALLYNLYPKNDIYFFKIPWHITTGIKINNKIYVLDQLLPVLTLEKWMMKWKKNKIDAYLIKVKNSGVDIEKVEISLSPSENCCSFKELEKEVKSILSVNASLKESENFCIHEIILKNYALYYENDEIVRYSIVRAIKNKLENEFCGNVDKIVDIKIKQSENKKDLILEVRYEVN